MAFNWMHAGQVDRNRGHGAVAGIQGYCDRNGEWSGIDLLADAVRILGEPALDPESTLGTEHLAKTTLASLVKKR